MKPTDVVYPVVLLVCIFAGAAVARFDGKNTIVASSNGGQRHLQHQVKWRRNHHIVTFHDSGGDTKRSPVKDQGSPAEQAAEKAAPATVAPEKNPPQPPAVATKATEGKTANNTTKGEGTGAGPNGNYTGMVADLVDMKTVFFILFGITSCVIGCFIFRIVRSRSRRKTKKYGVLTTRGNEVELTPLEQDDEDEDMTVFDVNST